MINRDYKNDFDHYGSGCFEKHLDQKYPRQMS